MVRPGFCTNDPKTQHVNREIESVTESVRVQENLDKAKAARRVIIRYIQLVNDEEYVGTLLEANEKVVEAIQLYDKVCHLLTKSTPLTKSPNPSWETALQASGPRF